MPADVAQPPVSPAPPLARHEQLHLVTVDTEAMPAIAIPTKTISTPHTGFQLDCEASDGRIHFIVKREFNAPPAKLRLARLARQTRNRSLGESSRPTPLAKRRPRVIVDATPPYRGNSRYFFFSIFCCCDNTAGDASHGLTRSRKHARESSTWPCWRAWRPPAAAGERSLPPTIPADNTDSTTAEPPADPRLQRRGNVLVSSGVRQVTGRSARVNRCREVVSYARESRTKRVSASLRTGNTRYSVRNFVFDNGKDAILTSMRFQVSNGSGRGKGL